MKKLLSLSNTWLIHRTIILSLKFTQSMLSCTVSRNFAYVYGWRTKQKKPKKLIRLLSDETIPNASKILADFEKAANFFSKNIPRAEISCCYFYLTQNCNRKIREIGLEIYCKNFSEVNLAVRMLPALSHVLLALVKASFELVIREVTDFNKKDLFEASVVEKLNELEV